MRNDTGIQGPFAIVLSQITAKIIPQAGVGITQQGDQIVLRKTQAGVLEVYDAASRPSV
jgi:hemin uptake protein HemP